MATLDGRTGQVTKTRYESEIITLASFAVTLAMTLTTSFLGISAMTVQSLTCVFFAISVTSSAGDTHYRKERNRLFPLTNTKITCGQS